tara:strand:- start:213 stop:590 length:378 start_codon:yes stop_codon:yes gene_type:complete
LYYQASDSFAVYTGDTFNTADRGIGEAEVPVDEWHHIRVVHDVSESDAYYFLDGVLTNTDSTASTNMFGLGTGTAVSYALGEDNALGGADHTGQLCGLVIRAGITASNDAFTPPTLAQMQLGGWD